MAREEVSQNIAELLGESDERPRTQITGVVAALGEQVALELVAETQRVEEAGGMLVPDGTRRRTPGGVFFVLARRRLSSADRTAIFGQATTRARQAPKSAGNGGPPPPPPAAPPMRRRAVEVVTLTAGQRPRATTGGEAGQASRVLASAPPAVREDLARAVDRASARRAIAALIGGLSASDQRLVLLDVLAELDPGEGEGGVPQGNPSPDRNSGGRDPGAGTGSAALAGRPPAEPSGYAGDAPYDQFSGRPQNLEPLRQSEPTPPRGWDPTGVRPRVDGSTPAGEPARNSAFDSAPPSPPRRRIVTPLVPPPAPLPSLSGGEDTESGTLRATVLGAIRKHPGIGLGELAERAYGEDSPINRKRVQTIVSNLKRDGKVRASARGRFEVS